MRINWKLRRSLKNNEKNTVHSPLGTWEYYKYTKERPIGDKSLVIDDHLKAAKDLWNQLMIHWKNMEEYLETSRALGRLQKYNIKTYWKLWFVVDDDMEDLWHQLMNHWKKTNHQC